VVALLSAGAWVSRRDESGFARSEEGALLFALVVLAAFLVYSGRFMASHFDVVRGYSTIRR